MISNFKPIYQHLYTILENRNHLGRRNKKIIGQRGKRTELTFDTSSAFFLNRVLFILCNIFNTQLTIGTGIL